MYNYTQSTNIHACILDFYSVLLNKNVYICFSFSIQ